MVFVVVFFLILIVFLGFVVNFFVVREILKLKIRKFYEYLILNLVIIDVGMCLISIFFDIGE